MVLPLDLLGEDSAQTHDDGPIASVKKSGLTAHRKTTAPRCSSDAVSGGHRRWVEDPREKWVRKACATTSRSSA
jgi:hypothetical protein